MIHVAMIMVTVGKMFVVIAHFKFLPIFLPILNNDVYDICIVYTSPEKSTS